MINVAGSGEAVCGNCGAHLEIVCSGGCAEPDIVFRQDYTAALPKPRGEEKPKPKERSTHCWCGDPVAMRKPGHGRPTTKCEKHLRPSRAKVPA